MSAENPSFWGMEDEERLSCTEIGERVQKFCEDYEGDEPIPETIELIGFDSMKVNEGSYAEWLLDNLLETLDEEYGDPDGDGTEPTEGMKQAANEFIKKVFSEYHAWNCEIVCKKTVHIKDYISDDEIKELGIGI